VCLSKRHCSIRLPIDVLSAGNYSGLASGQHALEEERR
jgi:hypothetical protein